ncbi:MAG: hypothetical protein ABI613_03585 [Gemmatimonadota bacterium]
MLKTVARHLGLCTLLLTLIALPAHGQNRRSARVLASPELGLRFGRDFSIDAWTVGAHVRVPLLRMVDFRPSGDLSLGQNSLGDDYQLNGDLALRGARDQAYLGGGVAYVHRRFDSGKSSGTGANLFIGFKPFPRPGAQLYLEGRWTLVDDETLFRLLLGVAFKF